MPKYKVLREKYSDKISLNAEEVHDGYFSKDGKGRMKTQMHLLQVKMMSLLSIW